MKNQRIRVKKLFASLGFLSLIFVSNSSELNARYGLTSEIDDESNLLLDNINLDSLNTNDRNSFSSIYLNNYEQINLAQEDNDANPSVLISEIVIEGWEDHPEGRKLELAAYDSMSIKPGTSVNNEMVSKDLNSIYASGWFSGVKIKFEEGSLGVRLIVTIVPNPLLKEVQISPENVVIADDFIDEIFNDYYGMTLNLNELQERINLMKQWYEERGYSLARINSPERISSDGIIQLRIDEGIVSNVQLRFIGPDEKIRDGKTQEWVIRRELQTDSGDVFNRKTLENDIARLYATSLFSDIKVSLAPDTDNPGQIIIALDISEQRTGSLTGGIGFSNSAGIFAQLGLQESNAFGRSWATSFNINFGEYSSTYNFSLTDPWIKGDNYRTAFKANFFLSRDYPQEFKSEDNGRLYAVDDQISDSNDTLSSIVLENFGGGFSFIRPLNGGDPFANSAWRVQLGMNFKQVSMIDSDRNEKPFATRQPTTANINEIICIGYTSQDGSCPSTNTLMSFLVSASRNRLNSSVSPTSGNVLRFGTEQFISLGDDSPTFNRTRISYAWFIPTRFINLTKDCRSEESDNNSCAQTIAIQVKAGTILGELPPYEAFCMGGSSSVRGWGSCDLAVSRSFAEATIEYRFPVWRMISGSLFADAGTDLGSQADVPGKPGELLQKDGSGFSLGLGIGVKTPIGPIRLDIASQDLSGEVRYTLGVGWKF